MFLKFYTQMYTQYDITVNTSLPVKGPCWSFISSKNLGQINVISFHAIFELAYNFDWLFFFFFSLALY